MAPPAVSAGAIALRHPRPLARAAAALAASLLALVLLVAAAISTLLGGRSGGIPAAGLPEGARPFLAIYADAAAVYRVNPYVLMAIHENETNFSTPSAPGVADGINFAGCCAGPMQFSITGGASAAIGGSGGTWAAYANAYTRARLPRPVAYPLRHERPHPNVYDSYDAIYAAASYLHQLGAGPRLDPRTYRALLRYTGAPPTSIPYAQHDYQRALELQRLAQTEASPDAPLPLTPGPRAVLLPSGLAAAPASAPRAVKGMVAAANEISDRSYRLVHYPTHLHNPSYDCSSSTSHVLWGGGLFGTAPWVSGQFMSWGAPGPGRWVTIYAHSGHVFMYVAGLRFDTSRYDSGPNANESGPRWRLGSRPLGGFAVRHPAGL
jgi:hypothetical protein